MYKHVKIILISTFLIPLTCTGKPSSPLSKKSVKLIQNNPQTQFVYVPQKIRDYIVSLDMLNNTQLFTPFLLDVFEHIMKKHNAVNKEHMQYALPELIEIYRTNQELCKLDCNNILQDCQTYLMEVISGNANISVSHTNSNDSAQHRVSCNLLIREQYREQSLERSPRPTANAGNLVSPNTDLQIPGDLVVGGCIYTCCINGSTPGTGGISACDCPTTFLDSQFAVISASDNTRVVNFNIQGTSGTTTTIDTNPTMSRNLITPDIDGTILVAQTGTNEVFIGGPTAPLHGSGSGIQYSSIVANRSQIRFNQYGNAAGIPGISTFKSRAAAIGGLAPVQPGDVIFRATSVGVTDNLSIPLSGLISINVPAGGVPAGQGYIATEYELQLVSLSGPTNGRRPVFKVTSEGVIQLLETTSTGPHLTVPTGVVTLDATGNVTVANARLAANARILLTVQPGVAPTGTVYVSAITANTSFTITSNAGAADSGVRVYYQIYGPLP